jgi:schlafen family protein
MPLEGLRRLALHDLDEATLRSLIGEEEHLFVERKVQPPEPPNFGAAVASFANTLGGWLLLGIEDKTGNVKGWKLPGRADAQSHIGQLLRAEVDPPPPFVAAERKLDGKSIVVVRVFESADTPHIVRGTGAVYTRTSKGKEPITDQGVMYQLARRGEAARREAQGRLGGLDLVRLVTRPPALTGQVREITLHVRAGPYTVTPQFSDWAISDGGAAAIHEHAEALAQKFRRWQNPVPIALEPHGRGASISWRLVDHHNELHATLMVDSGGVVAGRLASPGDENHDRYQIPELETVRDRLERLVHAVAGPLADAEAYGRVAWDMIHSRPVGMPLIGGSRTPPSFLYASADAVVPFEDSDLNELVSLWMRHLARESGLEQWEPSATEERIPPDDEPAASRPA